MNGNGKVLLASHVLIQLLDGHVEIDLPYLVAVTGMNGESIKRYMNNPLFSREGDIFYYSFPFAKGDILDFAQGPSHYRLEWNINLDWLIRLMTISTRSWEKAQITEQLGRKRINASFEDGLRLAINEIRYKERLLGERIYYSVKAMKTMQSLLNEYALMKGCVDVLTAPLGKLVQYDPRPDGPPRTFQGRQPDVKVDL